MAMISRQHDQRRRALTAAKLAVRAYARDPSAANAQGVELAWRRVRQIDAFARWQRPSSPAGGVPGPVAGAS